MDITHIPGKVLARIHRGLLRLSIYKKLALRLGLDSLNYKRHYKHLHYDAGAPFSDVDGYKGEGEFQRIVQLVDNLARIVPNPPSVLDIGCGTGRYLKQMKEVWPRSSLEGIDISAQIVEKFTRKQVPGIPIHILDIETDKLFYRRHKEKFHLITMIGIVQIISLRKIDSILDKVSQMCEEGGYLYVQFNVETPDKKSSVGYKRYSIPELSNLLKTHNVHMVEAKRTDILCDYAYIAAQKRTLS